METAASTPWVIRDCQANEAETVLALWRQAEATVSPTDTVEDLPALSFPVPP